MQITRPTLLLDKEIAKRNISRMAKKARLTNTIFRPHFKTHFSSEIGEWYREQGVKCCTVSSVEMASYFSKAGWEDITIAFPFNRLELPEILKLASKSNINLVVEDKDTLDYLIHNSAEQLNYYLKIDVGTGRTGLNATSDLEHLIVQHAKINFIGFLGHAGHAYRSRNNSTIIEVYRDTSRILKELKAKYQRYNPIVSYGDTPTCSVIERFDDIDEIRPGNFIFYDWMQYNITSCSFEDIAVCMAVPIVAKHKDRNEIVIHGGAVHFSKDYIEIDSKKTFGKLVALTNDGWEEYSQDCHLERLSQEHGILKVSDNELFDRLKVGDIVGVIPIHSCLAANLMGSYLTLTGNRILQMPKNTYL
jgi:D-serine deaminase-like pyridoxal phosphate-dependent protein